MKNQGRLIKVMIMLIVAMSSGSLVLLALEGKPIKPMPFSLSSQMKMPSVNHTLGTVYPIQPGRWIRIEVYYSENRHLLSDRGSLTGDLSQKYHFVIAEDSSGYDGQIFASPCWINQLPADNAPVNSADYHTVKICLLTDGSHISTSHQARQLQSLVSCLVKQCQIEPKVLWKN